MWAKDLLFGRLFGDKSQTSDLVVHNNDQNTSATENTDFFNLKDGETYDSYACRVFDGVFGHNIAVALKNEDTWKARKRPRPLYIHEVHADPKRMKMDPAINGVNGTNEHVSAVRMLGLNNPQEVWSLRENASVFLLALELFLQIRQKVRNLTGTLSITFGMVW